MTGRKVMIDSYLAGSLPTLTDISAGRSQARHARQAARVFTKNPFAKDDKKLQMTLTFAAIRTCWIRYGDITLRPAPTFRSSASCRCCLEQEP